jgi:hypothetical protein
MITKYQRWTGHMPRREFQLSDVRVRAGFVRISYLRDRKQLQVLRKVVQAWGKSVGRHASPEQADAIDFAKIALQRWSGEHTQGRTSASVKGIQELKKYNPNIEVGILATAWAEWFKRPPIVGICHFRCTWSGNIAIDYLISHPVLRLQTDNPLAGLGSGILAHVCSVAEKIGADAVWGETTPNSIDFYKGIIGEDTVSDLVILNKEKYLAFNEQLAKLSRK